MIHRYSCPVYGYDHAVWHISITNSTLSYCENCYSRYIRKAAHIYGFNLNHNYKRSILHVYQKYRCKNHH